TIPEAFDGGASSGGLRGGLSGDFIPAEGYVLSLKSNSTHSIDAAEM
ncbi:hypothetical protein AVEN_220504-1, partial [Araneus ventricosus]